MKCIARIGGLLTLCAAFMCVACNPTVDPASTFTAEGKLVDGAGAPLRDAEVRLIRYYSNLNLFEPSIENLFSDAPKGESDLGLEVELVTTARSDADGRFTMTFKGSDIATDSGGRGIDGQVEVSNVRLVVRDPSDATKRAGVFTLDYRYQQADKVWNAGTLAFWGAEATADVSSASTTGLIRFSWKKLAETSSSVRSAYRIDIGGTDTARLVLRCSEGDPAQGGCRANGGRLERDVSALSIYNFYSNLGTFTAYVQGSSPDYHYVTKFSIPAPAPNPTANRDPVGIAGIWAVGTGSDQELTNTAAVDGNAKTRERIRNSATAIYVRLPLGAVTDAGILNSVVKNAAGGCVTLEFNTTSFSDIGTAKQNATAASWVQKGKFCGESGAANEVSAVASFDTAASDGEVAAWLRLRALNDQGQAGDLAFEEVGEVAVYKKKI